MKRRKFIQFTTSAALAATGVGLFDRLARSQTSSSVQIQWLGHTCFSFTGDSRVILVNPFRQIGCTTGYRAPSVDADLVLLSSRLLDEGVVEGLPGNPTILTDPGIYEFPGMQLQGITSDHDRIGGRRFGRNVMWRWNQGGLNILHMGGIAGAITVEQQILTGRPDILLIPVGGSEKAYRADEAKQAIETLNPKIVIPTHYRTAAADDATCDIDSLEQFLTLMAETPVREIGSDTLTFSTSDLPESGMRIDVFSYLFSA